jgi:hypothetical protein
VTFDLDGRLYDLPHPWRRSRKGNAFFRSDTHLLTVFKYADRQEFGIAVKDFQWEEVRFETGHFTNERSALDHAETIIDDLNLEAV